MGVTVGNSRCHDGGVFEITFYELASLRCSISCFLNLQIYHQYVRLRKDFGRYPVFVDEGAEVIPKLVCDIAAAP